MAKVKIKLVGTWSAWNEQARQGRMTRPDGTVEAVLVRVVPQDPGTAGVDARRVGRVLGRVRDPHVLRLLHVNAVGDQLALVYEDFAGASLARAAAALRTANQQLPVRAVVEVGAGVARALAIVSGVDPDEDLRIVHLGPTPGDVLVDARGTVKVAGFGVRLEGTPWSVGPAGYEAPEGPGGAAASVYAVGALLVELLTGERPSSGSPDPKRHEATIRRSLIRVLARPGESVPDGVVNLVRLCLAREPSARPSLDGLGPRLEELAQAMRSTSLRTWSTGAVPPLVQAAGADGALGLIMPATTTGAFPAGVPLAVDPGDEKPTDVVASAPEAPGARAPVPSVSDPGLLLPSPTDERAGAPAAPVEASTGPVLPPADVVRDAAGLTRPNRPAPAGATIVPPDVSQDGLPPLGLPPDGLDEVPIARGDTAADDATVLVTDAPRAGGASDDATVVMAHPGLPRPSTFPRPPDAAPIRKEAGEVTVDGSDREAVAWVGVEVQAAQREVRPVIIATGDQDDEAAGSALRRSGLGLGLLVAAALIVVVSGVVGAAVWNWFLRPMTESAARDEGSQQEVPDEAGTTLAAGEDVGAATEPDQADSAAAEEGTTSDGTAEATAAPAQEAPPEATTPPPKQEPRRTTRPRSTRADEEIDARIAPSGHDDGQGSSARITTLDADAPEPPAVVEDKAAGSSATITVVPDAGAESFRVEFRSADPDVESIDVNCHVGSGNGAPPVVISEAGRGPCKVTGRRGDERLIVMVSLSGDRVFTCFEGGNRTCK